MADFERTRKKLIFIGVISVSLGIFHFGTTLIKQISKKNQLKKTTYYNPQELHFLATNSTSQTLFKPNPADPTEFIAKETVVEGVVDTKAPIRSVFFEKNEKQLIYSELRRLPIYSNNYLFMGLEGSKHNKSKLLFQQSTNFELYSLDDKEKIAPCISRELLSPREELLEETGSILTKLTNLSVFENVLVFLGLFYESLLFWFLPKNVINGIFIGYSDKEFGIRAGGMLALLGDLVYNTNDKTLVLRNANPVKELLKDLDRKIAKTKIKLFFSLGICGIIGFLIYKKRMVKIRIFNRKVPGNLTNIENVIKLQEENLCIICCEKPRSILPLPCLHLSCCKQCFELLTKNECPICRNEYEGYNEIFIDKLQIKNSL